MGKKTMTYHDDFKYWKKEDKRFTEIRPMLCENSDFGNEPSLYNIIKHYYSSNDVYPEEVEKYTKKYICEWLKMEKK